MIWFKAIIVDLIKEFFVSLAASITAYVKQKVAEKQIKKKVKEKIANIKTDKDPVTRAKRMRDLLGGL